MFFPKRKRPHNPAKTITQPQEPPVETKKFSTITFPIVRRVFPQKMLIHDIVNVQPMTAPVGNIFFMDRTPSFTWKKMLKAGIKEVK
jgi:hypothetical protein